MRDRRRASDARSCSYFDFDPTKVCSLQSYWVHKRKKRDNDCASVFCHQRNFTGEKFWARGYFATTVGLDEQIVRNYIRHQEAEDKRENQLELFQ